MTRPRNTIHPKKVQVTLVKEALPGTSSSPFAPAAAQSNQRQAEGGQVSYWLFEVNHIKVYNLVYIER